MRGVNRTISIIGSLKKINMCHKNSDTVGLFKDP